MRKRSFILPQASGKIEAYRKGVRKLTPRERILVIRLAEKLEQKPGYAMLLGIEANRARKHPNRKTDQKGLT